MVTSVAGALNVLASQGELKSYYQLRQAKDREADDSGESRGKRAAIF